MSRKSTTARPTGEVVHMSTQGYLSTGAAAREANVDRRTLIRASAELGPVDLGNGHRAWPLDAVRAWAERRKAAR